MIFLSLTQKNHNITAYETNYIDNKKINHYIVGRKYLNKCYVYSIVCLSNKGYYSSSTKSNKYGRKNYCYNLRVFISISSSNNISCAIKTTKYRKHKANNLLRIFRRKNNKIEIQ